MPRGKESPFDSIMRGLEEVKAVEAGKIEPGRVTRFETPDVVRIRSDMGMSQSQFATLLGISTRTLQDWEQGRRTPRGPARSLLMVAEHNPEAVLEGVLAGLHRVRGRKRDQTKGSGRAA